MVTISAPNRIKRQKKRSAKARRRQTNANVPINFDDDASFQVPPTYPPSKFTQGDFEKRLGQWTKFKTPWGTYQGIVDGVKNGRLILKVPSQYAPSKHAGSGVTHCQGLSACDVQQIGFGSGFAGGFGGGCGCGGVGCGRCGGCFPFIRRGPWCWFWFPIIIIIFVFPWFCW